ncbi:catechol 1,2-dioxygenase [Sphingobium indicum]|uniref:Catechol 1,2-dioxygenase n=3 Tax=Sphingobium indicum TaxID=332055 RepID=A0A1L5BM33_SPHIB|nr:catechol 1,2-dioxygenase [Sphingobium indicum B90A]RYM03660.1 catechol 1,2-dioxygenase [Sphingobium indicum]
MPMESEQLEAVVMDIVAGIRDAIIKHHVTVDQYRFAVDYLGRLADARELPLLLDVFLNVAAVDAENEVTKGSPQAIQGPYYREDAPAVTDRLKTLDHDNERPLVVRGQVRDIDGSLLPGAEVDIWHSTPTGKYSGFHDNIPVDYYRGKLTSDSEGAYRVATTAPVPYQIPNQGYTGALLEAMGRHSWRPAHVHFKVRKPGFKTVTTQVYFEGGQWVDSDCCSGVRDDLVRRTTQEDGVDTLTVDFVLDRAA